MNSDQNRIIKYKTFAMAFSYPDENFEPLRLEYDRLFRANEIWLYSTEYISAHEFQRANELADIMGFYKAFGVEPSNDRPDSIINEFEFMHYLIFKELNAKNIDQKNICKDAQKKFFNLHLYISAKKIADKIILLSQNEFYTEMAKEINEFLEKEKELLKR